MRKLGVVVSLMVTVTLAALTGAAADVDSPSDLSSVGVKVREVALGDLVADAVRADTGTPVAFVPAGGFREITVSKGKIKAEDILKCLQYPEDKLAVVELTGGQLARALERSVSIHPQKNMGFLQVSGIVFTFDPKSPKGSRVKSVKIGRQNLVNDRKYRVGTTEALAKGAYGYFTIWKKNQAEVLKKKSAAQAVTKYLSQRSSVDYRKANRILTQK